MKIVEYDDKYRDDMIFMVLEAKDAMGQTPRLNKDFLDVSFYYQEQGDMFWLALDDSDRVVGCLGVNRISASTVKLHRFFVKASCKRQGIGSSLLETAEKHFASLGLSDIVVHIVGGEYPDAKPFCDAKEFVEYQPCWMRKVLQK